VLEVVKVNDAKFEVANVEESTQEPWKQSSGVEECVLDKDGNTVEAP
jgi:hypothetical protein